MENLKEKIEIERGNILKLKKEIQKKIVGQDDMVRKILIGNLLETISYWKDYLDLQNL